MIRFFISSFRKGRVFGFARISEYLNSKLVRSPVNNLTCDEAHAEFSKLTDLIAAKNEELLSSEFGEATGDKFIVKV